MEPSRPGHPPEKPTLLEQLQEGARKAGWLASKGFAWWCFFWGMLYVLIFALVGTQVSHPPEALLGVLAALAFSAVLLGGIVLNRVHRVESRETIRQRMRRVTRLASTHAGILSVADLVAELGLTPEEAANVLRECSRAGLADIDADGRGVVIYRFHAYDKPLAPPDQRTAERPEGPELFDQQPEPSRRVPEHH